MRTAAGNELDVASRARCAEGAGCRRVTSPRCARAEYLASVVADPLGKDAQNNQRSNSLWRSGSGVRRHLAFRCIAIQSNGDPNAHRQSQQEGAARRPDEFRVCPADLHRRPARRTAGRLRRLPGSRRLAADQPRNPVAGREGWPVLQADQDRAELDALAP